jgi:glycosyltransferase involved in cell wall biosynthesis
VSFARADLKRRFEGAEISLMQFSVVVPAHNEERLLPRSLAAIERASALVDGDVEVIVSADRCSDATVEIAGAAGARVVELNARNIARVRNAGAARARGDVLVTIDADCVMNARALLGVQQLLASGAFVGGGTEVVPERASAGIRTTYALVKVMTAITGLSGGMFWCRRADFDAIGGFDETLLVAEDMDFARRLRAHGRRTGRRFTILRDAPVVASTRKFDRFGDWHMFAMAGQLGAIRAAWRGTDPAWADRYFFDFNDEPAGYAGPTPG